MAEVTLRQVSKRFGPIEAVRDLSFAIDNGEFVVLLGPSGAGKTTTLRLITGLERPDAGSISIDGRDVTQDPPGTRDIAFVFQQYSLYPHLSVYDNLAFPLRSPARRVPEAAIRKRVEQTSELLHIAGKLGNKATRLSGGEMQRVAIGRALVRDPSIYLMDEPLSSLDAKLRAELRLELKRIQVELGATILYVTHDQVEAMTMGDMIVVMNNGKIEQVGTPREVYETPKTRFVAGFVGSPPMNFFRGRLTGEGDRVTVETGTARFVLPQSLASQISGSVREIDLGVRPQHVALTEEGAEGALPVTVYAVERLGKENVVVVEDQARNTFRALTVPSDKLVIGDRVFLSPDVSKAFVFPCSD